MSAAAASDGTAVASVTIKAVAYAFDRVEFPRIVPSRCRLLVVSDEFSLTQIASDRTHRRQTGAQQ
jgi:hypothetical protein